MNQIRRVWYMDWIRIIVILILVPFHSAVTCSTFGDAFIKYNQEVPALNAFIWFMSIWNMPVLFVVSGMSSYFGMQYRTTEEYAGERYTKLIIPLLAGILIICTIMSYLRALYLGTFNGNYFQFYPHFFTDGTYPKGNLNWGHLWFLIYLYIISMVLLPVFRYIKNQNFKEKAIRASALFEKGLWVYLLALPVMITESFLRPIFPGPFNLITDWANFTMYLLLTFYGYLFALNQRILDNIERIRIFSLVTGVALFAAAYLLRSDVPVPSSRFLFPAYNTIMVFSWIFTVLGYAKKYLNFKNRIYEYLVNASFPVYIFHYLPITVMAYYIAMYDIEVWFKYFILVVLTYPLTFVIYEAVRKIPYVCFLFGIKKKKIPET